MKRERMSLLLKLLVLFSVVAAVGVGFLTVRSFTQRSTAASMKAALRASGSPLSGEELNEFYRVPAGETDTTQLWLNATRQVGTDAFNQKVIRLPMFGPGPMPVLPGVEWPQLDECRTALATTLDAEMKAVRIAVAAGGRVRFPVDFRDGVGAELTDTARMRFLIRLLALDCYVAGHDHDSERVIANIRGMFAMSDAIAAEPCLVSQLVRLSLFGITVRTLQDLFPHCRWSDQELAAIQGDLARADLRADLQRAVIGEQARMMDMLKTAAPDYFRADNEILAMELYGGIVDACEKPWADCLADCEQVSTRLDEVWSRKSSKVRYSGVGLLFPAFMDVVEVAAINEARRRAASVALGMIRQEMHAGKLPASLDQITPAFLEAGPGQVVMTIDPYTGAPLKLRQSDAAIAIYSVGSDRKSNAGRPGSGEHEGEIDPGFLLERLARK